MRKILAVAALALPLAASAANLLNNGSFETVGSDTTGFAGWVRGGTAPSTPAVSIFYGAAAPYPTGAYGEAIPADTVATNAGGDAVGARAAYFVDDNATETLSQNVSIAAGSYLVGFDYYIPLNGLDNAGGATFNSSFGGVELTSFDIGVDGGTSGGVWRSFSQTVTLSGSGNFLFSFDTSGGFSKDVVIDRAYVISAVPEPETYALMLGGLGLVGWIARRRRAV